MLCYSKSEDLLVANTHGYCISPECGLVCCCSPEGGQRRQWGLLEVSKNEWCSDSERQKLHWWADCGTCP